VWEQPLRPEDVQEMQEDSVIRHRFSIVLSVRYHNLRILLYRRRLESFLRAFGAHDDSSSDRRLLQSAGITSVQNCVDSAIAIISAVHTITLSTGWRRELLGAWNNSLYYSKSSENTLVGPMAHKRQPSMQVWLSLPPF
jgi:hypothetical protein